MCIFIAPFQNWSKRLTKTTEYNIQAATIFSFLDCLVGQAWAIKLLAQMCPNKKTACVKLKTPEYVDGL